jgi:hypothetical protein
MDVEREYEGNAKGIRCLRMASSSGNGNTPEMLVASSSKEHGCLRLLASSAKKQESTD